MSAFDLTERERMLVVQTLVDAARVDGASPIERAFIDHAMQLLEIEQDQRRGHRAVLLGHVEPERVGTLAEALPEHSRRLALFNGAFELCAADGELSNEEREHLRGLASRLELSFPYE